MSKVHASGLIKSSLMALSLALSSAMVLAQPAPPPQDGPRHHGGPGHHRGPGGPGGPGYFGGHRVEQLLDDADASDAQRAQVKQILQAVQTDLKASHESLRSLHQKLPALLVAPTIDVAAIEALRIKQNALHEQISKRQSQAVIDVARVLTPEQRAKLADKQKRREARFADAQKERKERQEQRK